jgi:MOSC domain-containing protein YiiM
VTGSLASINISNGGVPKRRLPSCVVTANGLQGDRQRDLRYHGGPDRAVCLFSEELIAALQAEGHPIAAGTIGENLTIGGISWNQMVPGAQKVNPGWSRLYARVLKEGVVRLGDRVARTG